MDAVVASEQLLARWIEAHGHRSVAYARELYLDCPSGSPERWVTELQVPIEPATA
jgi:effector-binding domain-containing protein